MPMMPYEELLKKLVTATLPRYHSVRASSRLLLTESISLAYGKPSGEVYRDLIAMENAK